MSREEMEDYMKKFSVLLALILVFSICCIPAYAKDTTVELPTIKTTSEDVPVPYGTLSGYGQKWHDPASDGYGGSFVFRVSGSNWFEGHLTVSLENFNADTKMNIEVYMGNQCIFRRKNVGRTDGPWEEISFNPATTGGYTVIYSIVGGPNTPGRINCWIY